MCGIGISRKFAPRHGVEGDLKRRNHRVWQPCINDADTSGGGGPGLILIALRCHSDLRTSI